MSRLRALLRANYNIIICMRTPSRSRAASCSGTTSSASNTWDSRARDRWVVEAARELPSPKSLRVGAEAVHPGVLDGLRV